MSDAGDTLELLDLRGEVCPFTFVRTKLRLEQLPPGTRLRVVVDHEPASRNVPRSAEEWGQAVLSVEEDEPGVWVIELEKRTPLEAPPGTRPLREPRHQIPAEIQVLGGDEIQVLRARNLSLSGVYVETPPGSPHYPPGAELELVVSHHGASIRTGARVIRAGAAAEGAGVGIVFDGLDAESRELLRGLIVRASRG